MRRRVLFYQAFYNFARPHQSLRLPLSEPEALEENQGEAPLPPPLPPPPPAACITGLFAPKWRHRTPAMAAGLTDHVWSFRELLTVKFEAAHSQSSSG